MSDASDHDSDTSDDDYTVITYEVDDPVAVITLNRPEHLNAWVGATDIELRDAVWRAAADPRVVGIVITGAGRGFCSGADMQILSGAVSGEGMGGAGDEPDGDFDGRFSYLMTVPKPVIAAVNGPVAGMGFSFAMNCDLRIVSPDALFVTAFAQRGFYAEWGVAWILPKLIGSANALDLLWTSRRVGGEEAYKLGLANYLVPADDLMTFARGYVANLAATSSPTSMAIMKRQVYDHYHRGFADFDRDERAYIARTSASPDFGEGVQAFLDRRPPAFTRLPTD